MFDRLVESTKNRQGKRAGSYVLATGVIYAIALVTIILGTIIGFSPALAEEYSLATMLDPPPPPTAPPPRAIQPASRVTPVSSVFAPPTRPPARVLPATEARNYPIAISGPVVHGAPEGSGAGGGWGIPGGRETGEPAPPPPAPRPAPKLEPQPTSEQKPQGTQKVSEGVLQGKAIKREVPVYPIIARTIKAAGPVQVFVTISEQGRVIDAVALNGHPTLRQTAVNAARLWVFSPTTLSGVPVKVQGVLTFNFQLQ